MNKRLMACLLAGCFCLGISGCSGKTVPGEVTEADRSSAGEKTGEVSGQPAEESRSEGGQESGMDIQETALDLMKKYNQGEEYITRDKYRTFYEVFVYSFFDGDDDGIGDLTGLTQKLDYINDGDPKTDTDLGADGIWLMPVMPSTTYHKYDVLDYMDIDPQYGAMEDFDTFMEACGERQIAVLIDLVMNHTSSEHEWFLTACDYLKSIGSAEPDAKECPYVDYYHFSREKKSEIYYAVEGSEWYYEGSFWSGMPDLNLSDKNVRAEFERIIKFWLDKGISGFRVDAAKEFESGNTQANVEILAWLNETVKAYREDAYIVAEVWTDMDTYEQYYASGIDSVFNFAFAQQDGIIAKALNQTNGGAVSYGRACASLKDCFAVYKEDFIDAPFYSNHDVARSAGYYSGDGSTEKTMLAQAMNLMMSGSAFLYYGEELGMKGSGKDENKRAPMYWQEDRNAQGMCRGPEGMDSIKLKYPSLEEQSEDGGSIYSFVREVIHLRNRYPEIARGVVTCLEEMSDENICVMEKEYEGRKIWLIWNLGKEEMQFDTLQLPKSVGEGTPEIGGALLTGSRDIGKEGGLVILPPYSMILLY